MRSDTKKRGRGRPRSFDEGQARARILESFWERGFAAVSLDDLSAATGMGRPSLYAAFGNKQAMYLASLEQFKGLLSGALRAMMASPDCRTGLIGLFEGALRVYLSGHRGCFIVGTATAEAPGSPAIRAALQATLAELDGALAAFYARFLKPEEAYARGRLTASFLHSLAVRARAGQVEAELRELIADAVELLACS